MEGLIIKLETEGFRSDTFDNLYRRVHTIKSNMAVIPSSKSVSQLAHHFESYLDLSRSSNSKPKQNAIDCMLKAYDLMNRIIKLLPDDEKVDASMEKESMNCATMLRKIA